MSDYVFDKPRWQSLTTLEQMGNISSEVGRALSARRRGDKARMNSALYRGLDLIDATAEKLAKDKSPRLKELLVAREQFGESILGDSVDSTLEEYFMQFAIAARLRQSK